MDRVAILEAQVRRGPGNSSKPPSSQGYDKPAPRSLRRPSGRGPGGQDGHEGAGLTQVAEPDEVLDHAPTACAGCGASLAGAPVVSSESRQIFDLPPIALSVVEHRLQHRRCACGVTTMAGAPPRCGAPVQYGPGVRAAAVYLVAAQHLPYARAAGVMSDLVAAPISAGSIAAWASAAAADLAVPGSFTDSVTEALAGAAVVHADETGLRVDGRLAWIHSASTPDLTLYTCHPRRGLEAMDAAGVIGNLLPAAVLVHDGWKPYATYDVVHALCNAHHLRELTGVAENHRDQAGWAEVMIAFLTEVHHSVGRAKDAGSDGFAPDLLATYRARYAKIIDAAWHANPDAARPGAAHRSGPRARAGPAIALLRRLDDQRDQVLASPPTSPSLRQQPRRTRHPHGQAPPEDLRVPAHRSRRAHLRRPALLPVHHQQAAHRRHRRPTARRRPPLAPRAQNHLNSYVRRAEGQPGRRSASDSTTEADPTEKSAHGTRAFSLR